MVFSENALGFSMLAVRILDQIPRRFLFLHFDMYLILPKFNENLNNNYIVSLKITIYDIWSGFPPTSGQTD